MRLLSVPEFVNRKQKNKIAVFGSGYSINNITPDMWGVIEDGFDTIAFNWFCKLLRPTTWYVVREQCTTPKRIEPGHDLESFVDLMKHQKSATKIVKDMSYRKDNYQWARNHTLFDGEGFIFKEQAGGCSAKSFRDDVFEDGIHHGKSSIYDVLHFCIGMKYEEILFCGIDLYDNRHFYLGQDEPTECLIKDKMSVHAPHKTLEKTLAIISSIKEVFDIKMTVLNPRSLLTKIIPVWQGEK